MKHRRYQNISLDKLPKEIVNFVYRIAKCRRPPGSHLLVNSLLLAYFARFLKLFPYFGKEVLFLFFPFPFTFTGATFSTKAFFAFARLHVY